MFKRSVRRLERKYRKSRQLADRLAWILKQKEKATFFQQKERAYWSGRIKENAAQPKRLWHDLDVLMRRTDDEAPACSQAECSGRAQEFSEFFDKKVSTIRDDTEHAAEPKFLHPSTDQTLDNFAITTPEIVIKLIAAASNKYCSPYPIPTSVVKKLQGFTCSFFYSISSIDLPVMDSRLVA